MLLLVSIFRFCFAAFAFYQTQWGIASFDFLFFFHTLRFMHCDLCIAYFRLFKHPLRFSYTALNFDIPHCGFRHQASVMWLLSFELKHLALYDFYPTFSVWWFTNNTLRLYFAFDCLRVWCYHEVFCRSARYKNQYANILIVSMFI